MSDADEQNTWGPPAAGDELATLLGGLERQRATFAWKVGGLDEKALSTRLGTSALTLGGLVKHLAFVEDLKFTTMLLGEDLVAPWNGVDWENDGDWPWHSAANDTPETLYGLWHDAVARSRASVAQAVAKGGLDVRIEYGFGDDPDEALSLRRLLVDVLEEYARHVGHADLIREAVDGSVGEDPPEAVHPFVPPA
ncbi:DinB family protein [Plantactinospora sp. KBS50]|uniref:DinB family protein n=1 Tax=Plantactinospora sp. KBS50 TaxID=2024580 RepID=UPI000BAAA9E6|nr:DinB family protein [Plantactinospora sp. KBS50]ASW54329.1 mini-circle protein [Plantactinospora sp. KBS50]